MSDNVEVDDTLEERKRVLFNRITKLHSKVIKLVKDTILLKIQILIHKSQYNLRDMERKILNK